MSKYFEELPTNVDPNNLPLRTVAPCWADGEVTTVDYDTKDAICECKYLICLVDRRNIIQNSKHKLDAQS